MPGAAVHAPHLLGAEGAHAKVPHAGVEALLAQAVVGAEKGAEGGGLVHRGRGEDPGGGTRTGEGGGRHPAPRTPLPSLGTLEGTPLIL